MPHETLSKFGYPQSLIARYNHWIVLLRPQQPTLGSLVIVSRSDVRRFSEIPEGGFTELACVIQDCESALAATFRYDKMNYLMLMMVDPQVHMHAIPRYGESRDLCGAEYLDAGWPGPPNLGTVLAISTEDHDVLLATLTRSWSVEHTNNAATT